MKIPYIIEPKLLDLVTDEFTKLFQKKYKWLDNTFGRVDRVKIGKNILPLVYVKGRGEKEYVSLLPDKKLGNYCYMEITDPIEIKKQMRGFVILSYTASLVFWYDFRTVFPTEHANKTDEHIKYEVFQLLTSHGFRNFSCEVVKLYDHAENIFKGYTLSDNLALQRPYGGFRIELNINYKQSC